ncbi:hypothetical protein BKA61DRAFT_739902 [Leptodontidium sp. MPI-SDFR-AT-0119]|nr:hypothetical protein BKA61DRAFT_739902 [Leptodontidium sp. MPI-SDFR-AT-0119]
MARFSILVLALTATVPFVICRTSISKLDPIVYPPSCTARDASGDPKAVYIDVMDEASYEIYHLCTTAGTFCSSTQDCIYDAAYSHLCPPDSGSRWVAENYVFCDPQDGICKAGPQEFPGSPCGCTIGCFEKTQWSNYLEMGCVQGNCTVLADVGKEGL